ncbi:MAG: protein kinase [Bryobacter sp.]|jgi:tRNA A-37 threonylcarbamoyl transferase component Bud32|nr:protein kinase [Bryobacter sp.]
MTADQWRRLDEAVSAALDVPPEQRAATLRAILGDDPTTLRQAEEMVTAEAEADSFFERRPAAAAALAPGERLGPWRLVRELGRGGMGVVWLAERADGQAEMRAAIKFLETPLAGGEARRRFAEEKRLLARLNHPHIARLLDAGLGEGGPPNFVLEYVEGDPITRGAAGLDKRERLRLLIQVAQAVHHAHGNLVIHRDLKPANILVSPEGGAKLLDFGIARLTEEAGDRTRTMFRALSVDYASPEQIRGEAVSTATDIYSLGLVFFEVLTGRRSRQWSERPIAEVIGDLESFRLPRDAALDRDLRAILDKATEPDARRRYDSSAALADDLERHLEQRPVAARPRSVLYSAQRFVARNRWAVGAGAVVALVVLSLGITALRAGWRAEESRRIAEERLRQVESANAETRRALERAEAERRTAEVQRTRAESQSRIAAARLGELQGMSFSLLNETYRELSELPGATAARARLIAGLLGRLERLREAGGDSRDFSLLTAEAHGRLAEDLGGANENLGQRERSLAHLEQQVRILGELHRRQPEDLLAARLWADARAALWQAEVRQQRQQYDSPPPELESLWSRLLAREPRDYLVLRSAGNYYFRCFQILRVEPGAKIAYLEKSLELWTREEALTGGGENVWRNLALAHKYLAGTLGKSQPSPRQLEHAEKARAYDQRRLDRNPANAQARMDLSFDLTSIGDYHETARRDFAGAARYQREALRLRRLLLEVEPANEWYQRSLWYPARRAAYLAWRGEDFASLAGDLAAYAPLVRGASAAAPSDVALEALLSGDLAQQQGRPGEACAAWIRAQAAAQSPQFQFVWFAAAELQARIARCPAP